MVATLDMQDSLGKGKTRKKVFSDIEVRYWMGRLLGWL